MLSRLCPAQVQSPGSASAMTESALAVIGWQTLGSALVNLREKAAQDAQATDQSQGDVTESATDQFTSQSSSVIACRAERMRLREVLDDLLHGDVFPKYVTLLCALVEVEQHTWGGHQHLWDDFSQLRQLLEQAHHLVVMCKGMKAWDIVGRAAHMKRMEAVRGALERFGDHKRLEEARAAHAAVQRRRGTAAAVVSLIDGAGDKAVIAAGAAPVAAAATATAVPDVFRDFHKLVPDAEAQLKRAPRAGIVGMAGAGKTTIARRVFERMKSRFAGCAVFLTVGREPDLTMVLQRAAAVLLPEKQFDFADAAQGRAEIAHELSRQELHTLLVLDDVWQPVRPPPLMHTASVHLIRMA